MEEGFDVGTVGILGFQTVLGGIGQGDDGFDVCTAAGGQLDLAHLGKLLQEHMGVVGVHGAVAAEIAVGMELFCVAKQVFQQVVCIQGVGHAVAVQVAVRCLAGAEELAVDGESNLSRQGCGGGVQILDAAFLEDRLGEDIRTEGVAAALAHQVVQGEANAVFAGAFRVVAELGLDLAIALTVHQDIGACIHRQIRTAQACALAQQGVITAVCILQGLGGGHEQALDQLTHGHAVG